MSRTRLPRPAPRHRRVAPIVGCLMVMSATIVAPHVDAGDETAVSMAVLPVVAAADVHSPAASTAEMAVAMPREPGSAAEADVTDSTTLPTQSGVDVLRAPPPAAIEGDADTATAPSTGSTVGILTERQDGLVDWAYDRFRTAGLTVPSTMVAFAPTLADCSGHFGVFVAADNIVRVCAEDASDLIVRQLMLHELAHAWSHEHLSPDQQTAFVDCRDAASWNDHADPWLDRATEHAAETIAWGLMDIIVQVQPIGQADPASLRAAFEQLTGSAPINDGTHPAADPTVPPAAIQVIRE